jgi:hypothetical protein
MIVGVLHLIEVFAFGVGISQGFLFGLVVSSLSLLEQSRLRNPLVFIWNKVFLGKSF